MPTYSYMCTNCGDKFDITQAFSDDSLTTCQKCHGKLRKIFNSVGVVFKGSGFYRTDSRTSGKNSSSSSATTDSSSAASSTSATQSPSSTESSSTSTSSTESSSASTSSSAS